MIPEPLILLLSVAYIGLLFAVAYYGDVRKAQGRSIISNPYIYALSLAIYCTAWTFYGSVGRAASTGVGFLPIYLGPTLAAPLWWIVLRKIIRISKHHRITSIADFIGSRYGKSALLAGVVTVIAVTGIIPYIALQLKAASMSFDVLSQSPGSVAPGAAEPFYTDAAFYAALLLAVFTILFGTRHLDVTERHEGLVAAIALESFVKLVAFLAVGGFVVYGLYDGFGDLFARGAADRAVRSLFTMEAGSGAVEEWTWLIVLSMLAVMLLPRQFQVAVVENVDEEHLKKAIWLFPLYLIAINLFVLPIAVAGLLEFQGAVDADTFVLTLPQVHGQRALALLVFIGGLSAAMSMVIVATTALSTMICNDLVMPVLLRVSAFQLARRRTLTGLLLGIRRVSIVVVLLAGYVYLRSVAEAYALVSIGLISFAAVAQFAPAVLGGIFWRRGTHAGALWGLVAGFMLWGYTLPLPSLVETGWLPQSFVTVGPLGIEWLRPYQLFGLTVLSPVPHSLFWSMLFNGGVYLGVSLWTRQSVVERSQAVAFVDVFRYAGHTGRTTWNGTAQVADLRQLLQRFLGWRRTRRALDSYAHAHDLEIDDMVMADEALVHHVERLLAGAIGAASARVAVGSVVTEGPLRMSAMMDVLDEAQQVMAHSRELEHKRAELERTTRKLKAANDKLKEIDQLKDEFVSIVTHELRTPLTAIRAISEILHANPDLGVGQRQEFLETIIKETERLSRLVEQVLDLQRLEAEPMSLQNAPVDLEAVVSEAATAMRQQMENNGIRFSMASSEDLCVVRGDRDRLIQVVLNLLSNAVKFCNPNDGQVTARVYRHNGHVHVAVQDNGAGIPVGQQGVIFEKFRQALARVQPQSGSGLGLAIARQIVHEHDGTIRVESTPGHGATFTVSLPASGENASQKAAPASEATKGCSANPPDPVEKTSTRKRPHGRRKS